MSNASNSRRSFDCFITKLTSSQDSKYSKSLAQTLQRDFGNGLSVRLWWLLTPQRVHMEIFGHSDRLSSQRYSSEWFCLYLCYMRHCLNLIHVKPADLCFTCFPCVSSSGVCLGHLHSANNHQFIIVWTHVLSHTGTHGRLEADHPFSLVPCCSRLTVNWVCAKVINLHTPSRHYLMIMISHKCLIVMTSHHQICGLAKCKYITLGQFMPRPLSLISQGQNVDCETGVQSGG